MNKPRPIKPIFVKDPSILRDDKSTHRKTIKYKDDLESHIKWKDRHGRRQSK